MNNGVFQKNVSILSTISEEEYKVIPYSHSQLPSVEMLREIIDLVKLIVFPGFFDRRQTDNEMRSYHIGVYMERLCQLLQNQIELAFLFNSPGHGETARKEARELTLKFTDRLPEIKRRLYTDVEAINQGDPAVKNYSEIIFCYPVVQAMTHYRIAHELTEMNVPVIPRIITEMAHSATGIDIHPGAKIGEYFAIDHGTGVVVGETCIIGNHVTLYQGVTLGAKHAEPTDNRHPGNSPRHPIIEDNVTIYSNSTLLGRLTIGHDSVIGGNIWLTESIPPYSRILQSKAIDASFTGGLGI